MNGIYRNPNEDSYVSEEQLLQETIQETAKPPTLHTPLPHPQSFDYWSARLKERQRIYLETEQNPNNIEIEFHDDTLIAFMSDLHVGGYDTDYERIEAEVKAIAFTPNAYVVLVGDVVDAFFFNPAQHDAIEGVQQQYDYVQSMIKFLAERGKLLIGVAGNHDLWIKKSGLNPYSHFTEQTGAYYSHGITYLTADVAGARYKITMNHQFRGHSIYNHTHSQMRAAMFSDGGAMNSDVVVSGHYHTKGVSQQATSEFGNESNRMVFMALGTYKATDDYTRTRGFPQRQPEQMYGSAILLGKHTKQIKPYYDILEGCMELQEFQEMKLLKEWKYQ